MAGEPEGECLRDQSNTLSVVLSGERGTAAARIVGVGAEEALIQSAGQERGLSKAGVSCHGDPVRVEGGEGLGVFHYGEGCPGPEADLSAGTLVTFAVGIDDAGEAVGKIFIVARYVGIAEGEDRVSAVDQLLGRLIEVRNVGTEVDLQKRRHGARAILGDRAGDGKGKLSEFSSAEEAKATKRGLAGKIGFFTLDLLRRDLGGEGRKRAVFLGEEQGEQFFFCFSLGGGETL